MYSEPSAGESFASDGFVIVGASYAGASFALAARKLGYTGPITLFTEEAHAAYDVPFLSKSYFGKGASEEVPHFKAPALFDKARVRVVTGTRVEGIDRVYRAATLSGGQRISYDYLVLATGTTCYIPEVFAGLAHIHVLKTRADAEALRAALGGAKRIAVVGGGVLGVELSHALQSDGFAVTLVERAERVMSRQVTPALSAILQDRLTGLGTTLRLGATIDAAANGETGIAVTIDGQAEAFDLVLVCAGAWPNVDLARSCRLPIRQGILVDKWFRTGDHHILAVGDCIEPEEESTFRINCLSVQHATETGRQAAEALIAERPARPVLPTFWSALGGEMIRMAGYYRPDAGYETRAETPAAGPSAAEEAGHVAVQQGAGNSAASPDFLEAFRDNSAYLKILKTMRS